MIVRNDKELVEKRFGQKVIAEVRLGFILIWEFARACFSRGWNNNKGWDNNAGWSND